MADQDETGLPAETDDGAPAAADPDTEPAGEPDADKTGGTPGPEAKPDGEPAKPSVEDIPLETLLEREDVKRWGQSLGDRAQARAETRMREQAKKREQDAKITAETAERRRLAESEDFEALGRRDADKLAAEERLLESLELASGVISQVATKRYADELGEETVERITDEVSARGGSVVDLTTALAEASTRKAVEKATGVALDEAERRFAEKLEARLAEAGLERREAVTKETGPVDKVSGAQSAVVESEEEKTYESMSEAYGKGDITWDELLPYKQEHDKERLKR